MPGRYNEISVEEIIASSKMQLRISDTTEHDDYIDMIIQEGIRHLGTLSIFKKRQCDIEIIDLKSRLPKGFHRLLGLRFTKTNTIGNIRCFTLLYVDKKFLSDVGCAVNSTNIRNFNQGFQIQHGFIHFNSDIEATEATLAFLGLNLDENGNIIIYEDYERALRNYACYQFTLAYSEQFKEATIERYKREWMSQKGWIKGNDAINDFQNNKFEIQKSFNALLTSDLVNL